MAAVRMTTWTLNLNNIACKLLPVSSEKQAVYCRPPYGSCNDSIYSLTTPMTQDTFKPLHFNGIFFLRIYFSLKAYVLCCQFLKIDVTSFECSLSYSRTKAITRQGRRSVEFCVRYSLSPSDITVIVYGILKSCWLSECDYWNSLFSANQRWSSAVKGRKSAQILRERY